jgi:hypothetical protein
VLSFPECSANNTPSLGNRRFAVGYSPTTFGCLRIFDSGKRSADKTSSNENPRRKIVDPQRGADERSHADET